MKLLVFDIEGTLFKTKVRLPGTTIDSTVWQAIANALGQEAINAEVDTHRKWQNNEYVSYLDWMKDTVSIHRRYGLTQSLFNQIIYSCEYHQDVIEVLGSIDRSKYEIVLISGGFRELAIRAQNDIGIIHAFAACEYHFDNNGLLHNFNLLPCDFEGKVDFINLMIREYKLGPKDWIFVGDGANDVPIAQRAAISVGYNPHPELRKVVTYSIEDYKELIPILNADS